MKTVRCNICGSGDGELVKKGVFGSPGQDVYSCASCKHFYLSPLLSDAEEERFYINDYPAFLLKRGDAKSLSPEAHFISNQPEAERRLGSIRGLLSDEKEVLEIGSASGFFLCRLREHVKTVYGVEPNTAYMEYSRSNNIDTHDSLKGIACKKFDVIFLYYVLEHVKEPVKFIESVSGLLKDRDSRIVMEVPNVNEALITLYKSPAYDEFVWQRAHCSYFSVEALKDIFSRLKMEAEFIPVQRYDLSNHVYWLTDGKPGGTGKHDNIFSKGLNEEYKKCLKDRWICDTILAIARKRI